MGTTGLLHQIRSFFSPQAKSYSRAAIAAAAAAIAVMTAGSCSGDPDKKPAKEMLAIDSIFNSEAPDVPESLESSGLLLLQDTAGGTVTVSFNAPSMKNAKVYGFIFDARGAFRGEIGYHDDAGLKRGRAALVARRAASGYDGIATDTSDMFPDGTYTIHGKFDIHGDGFDGARGDRGFRVRFAVSGNTTVTIGDADTIKPCSETITATNRPDLKFATVYAYMYFPGGNPLHSYACRYDGGVSYVKINHCGNDLGNTMSEELNSGVYDVLIIADMDDSIDDPDMPALSNGDRFTVVKNMVINGNDPIDISGCLFKTHISDSLPAPRVSLQTALNAVTITIRNIVGAASYNVYGRSTDGYTLIGTIPADESGDYTLYDDFGPNGEYDIYGLPSDTRFCYRVTAVKKGGAEGQPGQWAEVLSGGVERPYLYADKSAGPSQLDLAVNVPRYCQEIEITARAGSCGGSPVRIYSFAVGEGQRDRGVYYSLADLPMDENAAYAFTVRGKDMYGVWSEPSPCYLVVVQQ